MFWLRGKFWLVVGKSLAGVLLLVAALIGFGVSSQDARTYRTFCSAVERWQTNPDFRHITPEYAQLSYDSLQTRPLLVRAPDLIMAVRSTPGLPKHLAVTDTSRTHYENFANGPLSAYLHLTTEQSCKVGMDLLERMAGNTDEDCRWFLESFSTNPPIVVDRGSLDSVRRLRQDTDASREYVIRSLEAPAGSHGKTLLHPYIESLAHRLGYSMNVREMTPEQQQDVLEKLDQDLRLSNYELWRTKQVNDFLCGIWAQAYGQPYVQLMDLALAIRTPCRVLVPAVFVAMVLSALHKRARRHAQEAMEAVASTGLEGRVA